MRSVTVGLLSVAALASIGLGAAGAASPRSSPAMGIRDDCGRVPGYSAFRARLEAAVRNRDAAAFRALISPKASRIDGNLAMPAPNAPGRDDPIWGELDKIMALGCGMEKDFMLMPYMATIEPVLDADSMHVAIRSTMARRRGATNSAVIATLPRGTILLSKGHPEQPVDDWTYVTLRNGRTGFIPDADLRSFGDLAIEVRREGDEWRIVSFNGYD